MKNLLKLLPLFITLVSSPACSDQSKKGYDNPTPDDCSKPYKVKICGVYPVNVYDCDMDGDGRYDIALAYPSLLRKTTFIDKVSGKEFLSKPIMISDDRDEKGKFDFSALCEGGK